jgi:hypothetical protein
MSRLREKFINWIEKNEFDNWKKERASIDIIYQKLDAKKIHIAERAFNVTFASSVQLQRKLDLWITGIGLVFLLAAGFFALANIGISMIPNNFSWTTLIFAPIILFLVIPGIFILGMYLTVFLIPFANAIRFLAVRISARLSFIVYLRSLNL